jgi:hypothetical protein
MRTTLNEDHVPQCYSAVIYHLQSKRGSAVLTTHHSFQVETALKFISTPSCVTMNGVFLAGRGLYEGAYEREAGDTRSRALQSGKPNTHRRPDLCCSLIQEIQ